MTRFSTLSAAGTIMLNTKQLAARQRLHGKTAGHVTQVEQAPQHPCMAACSLKESTCAGFAGWLGAEGSG
jgi:hypothetical protein